MPYAMSPHVMSLCPTMSQCHVIVSYHVTVSCHVMTSVNECCPLCLLLTCADPTLVQTGHTPLHEASAQGQTRMALLLLSLGGDVTQADKVGLAVGVDCTGSRRGMWSGSRRGMWSGSGLGMWSGSGRGMWSGSGRGM